MINAKKLVGGVIFLLSLPIYFMALPAFFLVTMGGWTTDSPGQPFWQHLLGRFEGATNMQLSIVLD